jgi:hypothetical protein
MMNTFSVPHDRLPFKLKPFLRVAWASPHAATTWSSRVAAIDRVMTTIEWKSVAEGLRPSALVSTEVDHCVTLAEEWQRRGLAWGLVSSRSKTENRYHNALSGPPGRRKPLFIVAQSPSTLKHLSSALAHEEALEIAGYLGCPACCARLLHQVCVDAACTETTWAMAIKSGAGINERTAEVRGSPVTNILLSPLGVRAVPHRPCSFRCEETKSFAVALRALAVAEGTQAEEVCRWRDSALAWPAEWSALHGIAEVVTPLVKLCFQSDATAAKYVVRWYGDEYPPEASRGLHFPFLRKTGQPTIVNIGSNSK